MSKATQHLPVSQQIVLKYRDDVLKRVAALPEEKYEAYRDLDTDFVNESLGRVLLDGSHVLEHSIDKDNDPVLHFTFKDGDTSLFKEHILESLGVGWRAEDDTITISLVGVSPVEIPTTVDRHKATVRDALAGYQDHIQVATKRLLEAANESYWKRAKAVEALKNLKIYKREESRYTNLRL